MQTLNTLSTPEEKLAALCKKYAELVSSPLRGHLPCLGKISMPPGIGLGVQRQVGGLISVQLSLKYLLNGESLSASLFRAVQQEFEKLHIP